MKRSELLAPLSREHHPALTLALQIRRCFEAPTPDAIAQSCERVRQVFLQSLYPHFLREEAGLLPQLVATGNPEAQALVDRTLAEHAELVTLHERLQTEDSERALRRFGELLAAHVRFEERELFECAQTLLTEDALGRI